MADRHLQRHEAAIAVAEHDGGFSVSAIPHRFGHSIGDSGKTSADRRRAAEARQFRNDDAERLRQLWRDRVETGAIRQQRVKQE